MVQQVRIWSEQNLSQWRLEGPISGQIRADLLAHPAFADAANRLVVNMLSLPRAGPMGSGMFRDAGHYVAGMSAIYLHASGGLTMQRLKTFCVGSSYLSPGRARAMLIHMQYLGFVELLPTLRRGQSARYLPTARFLTSWRHHLHLALEAAALIAPDIQDLLDRFDEAPIFERFAALHCEALMQTAAVDSNRATEIERVFLHRLAGANILNRLIGSPEAIERQGPGNPDFPPGDPIFLSVAGLAREFRVSRLHVSRLLDDAKAAGLIARGTDGAITLLEPARVELLLHYSSQLICLLAAAAGTVAQMMPTPDKASLAPAISLAEAPSPSSDVNNIPL